MTRCNHIFNTHHRYSIANSSYLKKLITSFLEGINTGLDVKIKQIGRASCRERVYSGV